MRGVCGEWSDSVKAVWCQIVKNEMLEQVHSLDLLYEKETTSKLLEFKLKYLCSYRHLMMNYFTHMKFDEISTLLNASENLKARQLVIIGAMIVGPLHTVS